MLISTRNETLFAEVIKIDGEFLILI